MGNREAELKPSTLSSLLLFRVSPQRYSTFKYILLELFNNIYIYIYGIELLSLDIKKREGGKSDFTEGKLRLQSYLSNYLVLKLLQDTYRKRGNEGS